MLSRQTGVERTRDQVKGMDGSAIRNRSTLAAMRPISVLQIRTVLSGGSEKADWSAPSKPVTMTSSGTAIFRFFRARRR